jgi:hypothetical protein
MSKNKASILVSAAFIVLVPSLRAHAGPYTLNLHGGGTNFFSPANCGDELGDTYDVFCPSRACSCSQYDDEELSSFQGNVVGSKQSPATVHFTLDGGDNTGFSGGVGLGCRPVFGQMVVNGSKDQETIYFNGSLCTVYHDCALNEQFQSMTGGWSIQSSSNNIKAFGTFTGSFAFCNSVDFSMRFTGQTQ